MSIVRKTLPHRAGAFFILSGLGMLDTTNNNFKEAVVAEKGTNTSHSFRACSGLMLELGIMSTSHEQGFVDKFRMANEMREDRGRVFLAGYLATFAEKASDAAREELVLCLESIGVSNPEGVLKGEQPLPAAL